MEVSYGKREKRKESYIFQEDEFSDDSGISGAGCIYPGAWGILLSEGICADHRKLGEIHTGDNGDDEQLFCPFSRYGAEYL